MFRSSVQRSKLEAEIDRLIALLRECENDPSEYDKILARIEKLHKFKDKPNNVSAETWALIAANLVGIVIVITHEYHHPITTKALSMAIKPVRAKL